jgi:hypothetical protein
MHWVSKTAAALLLATSAAGLATGCAENDSSVFIVGVFNLSSSDCLAKPDAEAELMFAGTIDLAFTTTYDAALLVGNQLTQQGNRERLRTETSRMRLQGADVTLFRPDGSEVSFTTSASGFVHSADGVDPSYAAVSAQLVRDGDLPPGTDSGIAIARVRVFGESLGGEDVESGDFDFPINVCNGCLVRFPPEAILENGQCVADAEVQQEQTVCYFGQDVPFPCTACIGHPACSGTATQ